MPGYCACAGCKNSTKTGHSSMASRRTRQPFDSGFTLSEAGTFFNDLRHRQYQDLQRAFQGGLRRRGCQNGITRVEDREAGEADSDHRAVCAQHLFACRYHTERHRESRDATMLIDAAQQETADSVDVNDPLPSTCDTGTQCNVKPRRSHAVQVNLKPKMVSVRTQTQTSTPLTSPDQTDDEDDPSVISDSSWVPGGHMSEDEEELCEEEPSHTCDPHQNGIDKFIVCQEVLMSLFALCPACCEKSDSLCIMWLPTFLAKPANAPQEHGVSYFGSHNRFDHTGASLRVT
ncbi:hypothetical protein N1851_027705 [Merluccius polli]|uniref:Uncharacterized protein n=1 Tax=Merluccius polli TaxID=89951 RepID=A0AA47MA42_MERPO|nr:hypothetical protein N1851_027705 [Merluccius polli]